jgi:hypothetical protein
MNAALPSQCLMRGLRPSSGPRCCTLSVKARVTANRVWVAAWSMRPRPHQNRIFGIVQVDGRGYSAVALRRQDKVAKSGARERSSRAWDNTDCRDGHRLATSGSMASMGSSLVIAQPSRRVVCHC